MCPINFVFISRKVKKQEFPEYYSVVNLKTLGSHLKITKLQHSRLSIANQLLVPGLKVKKRLNSSVRKRLKQFC